MTGGPTPSFQLGPWGRRVLVHWCSEMTVWLTYRPTSNLQVGCREQMRFQFSFEGLSVCGRFNFYWQLIPDAWCSDREDTFAELQFRLPGNKVIVAGGPTPSFQSGPWGRRVLVHWCSDGQAGIAWIQSSAWLERSECWCHVISWWKATYKSSSCVRVLMPVAQPEEQCSIQVVTKRMPRLDEPLSPVSAGGA